MNYLAHLALAGAQEKHRIGAFLGDFVKGPLRGEYDAGIEAGIRQHRAIDAHSDQDDQFTRCRLLLGKQHRRYSGIAIDILFDHLLARHWERFYAIDFNDFCERSYRELLAHKPLMPERARHFAERMQEHQILHSYYHRETLSLAINRTALRLREGDRLVALITPLETHYQALDREFLKLYPQLQSLASRLLFDPDQTEPG
ncbi:ACP phosphodiesterase [Aestuariirhabdus litorea]|uniref:DUF479 domain-containing protein n=1 Tax=Aestuariirhabdus litorea TaxID=2528527 RepID=A0A3P3VI99_9GAMM|nr:ACP phosphodiesterase [Aestuariirhabdus litorea]RRJ82461.1 DUF479 domain-containing protein [Aestuariirhabdus litorea]RWW92622.1 DUF479 domain-containing protein [Endozoicomonadaceae bacterium GTF-13]